MRPRCSASSISRTARKNAPRCFGGRLGFVPYLMPGFGLAKKAIEVFERDKPSDGLILGKHGIVTFGESAREAYERMIEMVSLAEDFIARSRKAVVVADAVARARAGRRGRADRARRLQPEGREDRRRLAPAGARISRRRRRF